jgi:hypothetical protein
MGSGKRLRLFTADEKLAVIRETEVKNCATGQKHDIP